MAPVREVVNTEIDELAGSDDNDALLLDESDAPVAEGTSTRRRLGIASAGVIMLGLIAMSSYKLTSRRSLTREEFGAMMKKFDALSPFPGYTVNGSNSMKIGDCVVDANEAQGYFGKMLVSSGSAQSACALDMGSDDCLTNVLEIFSSLGFMGDFIGNAAGQCNMTSSALVGCSSELLDISSALVDIAQQAIEINRSCVPTFAAAYGQALESKELWDVSKCLVDVDLLADHATHGGIFFGEIEEECAGNSGAAKEGCGVDILNLIAQLGGSATFLASGMVDCSPKQFFDIVDVKCAEAISGTIGEIFALASAAAVLPGCANDGPTP